MKIIFLGPQGSGKSTQAKLLAESLSLPLIEMGQMFRDRAQGDDEEALRIRSSLSRGELVPDQIVVNTLKKTIAGDKFKNGYILDGYPRNAGQMNGLPKDIDKVFYVKISDKEAIRRLLKRGRDDDTEEALKKRLEIYHSQTEPLLEKFEVEKKLLEIYGERSIEEVHQEILNLAKKYEKQHS